MIDQHMMQRMAAFRKVISDRDAQMMAMNAEHENRLVEIDDLAGGLAYKVSELDGAVKELLRSIAVHEEGVASCNDSFAAAKVRLQEQYNEAIAELVSLRDIELARLDTAVAQDRATVVETDARLTATSKVLKAEQTRRAIAVAEHEEQLRKLRAGKYAEAKRLLAELEARVAKREAQIQAEAEAALAEPPAEVRTDSGIMCQHCGKIAKPWVLSSSGIALCLDCAQGKMPTDKPAVLVDVEDGKVGREVLQALSHK